MIVLIIDWLIGYMWMGDKKLLEPWFSDLESDVLTIERPRIGDIDHKSFLKR